MRSNQVTLRTDSYVSNFMLEGSREVTAKSHVRSKTRPWKGIGNSRRLHSYGLVESLHLVIAPIRVFDLLLPHASTSLQDGGA